MSPLVFIFGCVALFSALIFATICAYKFGKYQGWQEALRQYTQYEKADMILDDGETPAAVVEMRKGTYFFLALIRSRILLGNNVRAMNCWETSMSTQED